MQRFFPNKTYVFPVLFILLPLMAMTPWKKKKLRNYFPLKPGSMWQYNVYSRPDQELMIHDSIYCTGDTMISGKRYVTISGRKTERVFPAGYWRFEKTTLYRYHTIKKCDVLFADFSKNKGEQRVYTSDSLVYNVRVLSTDTTYEIPQRRKISWSGELDEPPSFADVYCLEWTEMKNADTAILFFKQGVGLVGLKMGGGQELYLKSYSVQE